MEPGTALIAGHYQIDPGQVAPVDLGGARAFRARDWREPERAILAVASSSSLPARASVLTQHAQAPIPNVLTALDQGRGLVSPGVEAWFVFCHAPPGPALLAEPRVWSDADILRSLLLPASSALDAFAARGMTHRAIRPNNLFRAGPAAAVTLGPCWAAPPASLQPGAFEPPYSAMCLPAARGAGSIADDVYALGATMLWCALGGAVPWWGAEDALLRAKLAVGSFRALLGQASISGPLADLLAGMLAEDPEHRPSPSLLLDPMGARSRRLSARPAARAQRPLDIGPQQASTARELAYCLAREPERGAALLKSGAVDTWLRRMLGDGALATRLEEVAGRRRAEQDADVTIQPVLSVLRAIAVLDPLAPLVWRGAALFPDGLGPAFAAAEPDSGGVLRAHLEELVAQDGISHWAACEGRRRNEAGLRQDARLWQSWLATKGPMGGRLRLLYALNPLLPCQSPLLSGRVALRLFDLLPALEDAASQADRKRMPLDAHILAFIAARADAALLAESGLPATLPAEPGSVLTLLAALHTRTNSGPLPNLAGWLLESGVADTAQWRSRRARTALEARLRDLAASGQIAPMLSLLRDEAARERDRIGAERARARVAAIRAELAHIDAGSKEREQESRETGLAIASGLGLAATLLGAASLALG